MMTRPMIAGATGPDWMRSAHFGQKPFEPAPTTRGPLAARFFFCLRLSTRGPMKLSRAGSRVRAAIMVKDTPIAAAMASP